MSSLHLLTQDETQLDHQHGFPVSVFRRVRAKLGGTPQTTAPSRLKRTHSMPATYENGKQSIPVASDMTNSMDHVLCQSTRVSNDIGSMPVVPAGPAGPASTLDDTSGTYPAATNESGHYSSANDVQPAVPPSCLSLHSPSHSQSPSASSAGDRDLDRPIMPPGTLSRMSLQRTQTGMLLSPSLTLVRPASINLPPLPVINPPLPVRAVH